jgi:hypothetical protein
MLNVILAAYCVFNIQYHNIKILPLEDKPSATNNALLQQCIEYAMLLGLNGNVERKIHKTEGISIGHWPRL